MQIQYKNFDGLAITAQQAGLEKKEFYKEIIENGLVKKIEYHWGVPERNQLPSLFELIYYKDANETNNEIIAKYSKTESLYKIRIRTRSTHGIFSIDNEELYSRKPTGFVNLYVENNYLYDSNNNLMAHEVIHTDKTPQDPDYRIIWKYYFDVEANGKKTTVNPHFEVNYDENGDFAYIEYNPDPPYCLGFDLTQYFDQEADDFMTSFNIPSNLQAWYKTRDFLPPI